jgi:5'-3' exonuclease
LRPALYDDAPHRIARSAETALHICHILETGFVQLVRCELRPSARLTTHNDLFVLREEFRDDVNELGIRRHLARRRVRPYHRNVQRFRHMPVVEFLFSPDVDVNHTCILVENVFSLLRPNVFDRHADIILARMEVYLIDGTYELFRHFFAVPSVKDANGQEIGATRAVVNSVRRMVDEGVTHVGVATDHVIESFRNELYAGYKTGEGIAPELYSQFPILEKEFEAIGVRVWPMIEFEADDALASAATKAADDPRVTRVVICTPDKDLSQCVSGTRIVQLHRRTQVIIDEAGVVAKFGVRPESIPDYLALVGDSADGFPGVSGWGKKAAASILSVYPHFEDIPKDWKQWTVSLRNAPWLAKVLFHSWDEALLFRTLATLRTDVPVFNTVDELRVEPRSGTRF